MFEFLRSVIACASSEYIKSFAHKTKPSVLKYSKSAYLGGNASASSRTHPALFLVDASINAIKT